MPEANVNTEENAEATAAGTEVPETETPETDTPETEAPEADATEDAETTEESEESAGEPEVEEVEDPADIADLKEIAAKYADIDSPLAEQVVNALDTAVAKIKQLKVAADLLAKKDEAE